MTHKASLKRLQFCNYKLDTLLNITKLINSNLSTGGLVNHYETLLREELNIGRVLVFSYNKEWKTLLESGVTYEENEKIDFTTDLLPHTEIITTYSSPNLFIQSFDLIIPVYHNNKALAYVLIGDIDEEMEGMSPTIKHLRFIQTLTNIVIVAIENKRLYRENLRQEAVRKELELASQMQAMLIPDLSLLPKNDNIFVDAFYLPHFDVGGDYYDFFPLNGIEFGFCMADVSGKGISAAILMSNFQANLKALFTVEITLEDLIRKLNNCVLTSAKGEKFITLFVGKYNTETHKLTYVNAGHIPPILYEKESSKIVYLESGCPGIGMLENIPVINEGNINVKPSKQGVKLLCYTDGLVELKGEDDIRSGIKAIERNLTDNKRIDESIRSMIEYMKINRDNNLFFDDISILGLELY